VSIPTTYEALIIVVLVFVPGIILSQLVRSAISFYPDAFNAWHFVAMGATGLFLHTLVFPFWTRFVLDWYLSGTLEEHWLSSYLWFVMVIFIWPVIAGLLIAWAVRQQVMDHMLNRLGMSYVDRTPTAWDWAVRIPQTRWVRIYLIDGEVIGGWYGRKSFASLTHSKQDIYLEEMWLLDENGTFSEPHVNTDGVWVAHDAIRNVVFQTGQSDEG
jgi:hypothetical protein